MQSGIIIDKSDPREVGMFSNIGRYTTEMHPIIMQRDDILNDRRKFFKIKYYDQESESSDDMERVKKILNTTSIIKTLEKKQDDADKALAQKKLLSTNPFRPMDYIQINMETPPPTRYHPKPFKL